MNFKLFTTVLLFAFASNVFGQKLDAQIDKLIAEKYTVDGPGGAILVSQKGKIIYQKGFGKASIELNVNNSPDNVFEIGSITKQYTAVCILMLEEQGKLKVTDAIEKYLPDYPRGNEITIHQLLTHIAGVVNYTALPEWTKVWREDKTVDEMIAFFKDKPLDFEPGAHWNYSNSGYILLGAIIEKISGMTYGDFVEQNIFNAIGMNNSYYGSRSEIIAMRAQGYQSAGEGKYRNAEYLSLTHPYASGSIMSTVGDQLIWIKAIANNKLISEASKKKAWTPCIPADGKNSYHGYGWTINEINGSPTIEHGGGIFGFVSFGIYMPEEDIFVSILTNRDGISPDDIAIKAAAIAAEKPYTNPAAISMSDEQLEQYVAIYDFENGTSRTITREGNQLFSQRSGGTKFEIYPYESDKFYFKDSFTRLDFKRDNMNKIGAVITIHRIDEETAKRTNKEIVEIKEIQLSHEQLKRLEGDYELDPSFIISVKTRERRLFAQATGQPEFELYAESPLKFFLKVVDAQVDFVEGEDGSITKMILHQGGQDMEGKKN